MFVSAYQKPLIKINIFLYFLLILILFLSILADFTLYDFISIIKDNLIILNPIRPLPGIRNNKVKITGDSLFAKLLQSLTNDTIQHEEEFKQEEIIEDCGLKISELKWQQIKSLIGQVALLFLLILIELYVKRFNKYICAFFYEKVEKRELFGFTMICYINEWLILIV